MTITTVYELTMRSVAALSIVSVVLSAVLYLTSGRWGLSFTLAHFDVGGLSGQSSVMWSMDRHTLHHLPPV